MWNRFVSLAIIGRGVANSSTLFIPNDFLCAVQRPLYHKISKTRGATVLRLGLEHKQLVNGDRGYGRTRGEVGSGGRARIRCIAVVLYDLRPPHPYHAATEHVEVSLMTQISRAPTRKQGGMRVEVFGGPRKGWATWKKKKLVRRNSEPCGISLAQPMKA